MKIWLFAFLFCASIGCQASPNKIAYELKERCGEKTQSEFRREFGKGIEKTDAGLTIHGYLNHYNGRLNACIYLLITHGTTKDADEKKARFVMETLFDFNENREIGSYYKLDGDSLPVCNVDGKVCGTRADWEALIKPYMED
jgi:hypothetical protein